MITDTDIKKLSTVFATKQDFARSATKKDLENLTVRLVSTMAYKQDVVAIREDVNRFERNCTGTCCCSRWTHKNDERCTY
jgi:hypothetical protein